MKKLILLQNDYPSTGKSTLAHCFSHYLKQFGVAHQRVTLLEDAENSDDEHALDASTITKRRLFDLMEEAPITLLESASGMGEFFCGFYQNHHLEQSLDEEGVSLSVVLPVTTEVDSFDSVIEAVETFSDHAEYTIAHLVTSCYEEDERAWDRSYAARVMDMYDAVELHIPEVGFQVELELRARHLSLSQALMDPGVTETFGKDYNKWLARVTGQIDSARRYLFGEAFRPTTQPRPVKKTRSRAKAA
ncbi:MAG TPA: hypothetical protein DIT13_01820 [Verrucomicrobiales bacterium]|nr:hypothetical protein [Verrucomicrobiales bacterium]HRJ09001.1 hypothetical protein [Prosthecobacter sp.]HRK13147.1 hypothetical protein [Prosthecobacter sp.]